MASMPAHLRCPSRLTGTVLTRCLPFVRNGTRRRSFMPALDTVIRSLCFTEMAEWNSRKLSYDAALADYQEYNATRRCTFLLAITKAGVSILDKPEFYSRHKLDGGS